ncbi:MAG: M48 family metallopeptidase [Magnetococcales bacterium]|nr:M48 family metallopeptidase [Magnetococcales bacterium]MBF0156282.1 M48 family metallopeptidase [Magnetococcales bacterium]
MTGGTERWRCSCASTAGWGWSPLLFLGGVLLLAGGCAERSATRPRPEQPWGMETRGGGSPSGGTLLSQEQVKAWREVQGRVDRAAGIRSDLAFMADHTPNAFAWREDGGFFIGLTLGLVEMVGSDSHEMAFVLGHEMAHHRLRHVELRRERSESIDTLSNLLGIGLNLVGIPLGDMLVNLGGVAATRSYSREDEREADRESVRLMRAAGFDSAGAIRFLEALDALDEDPTVSILSTHPVTGARVTELREWLGGGGSDDQGDARARNP